MRRLLLCATAWFALSLAGCMPPEPASVKAARLAQSQAILREPPGNYFIGRRYYLRYHEDEAYKFWGYVRKPGQPWKDARLVIFNEKLKLAPDRASKHIGEDDNCEYRLFGRFTGDTVYEPPSDRLYPEFQLTGCELLNRNPPSLFAPNADLPLTAIRQPD